MPHAHAPSVPPLPLAGLRVVDFSRLLPGPWASQMLAEFGAEVIKVEPPGVGDPSRHNHPRYRDQSVYFNVVNGSKRSLELDLATVAGREVARRLFERADVVFESYRPGVAAKLGVDYASARAANERIIYCSISGFGQSGPLAKIAGHDLVIQGMTGLMGRALEQANPPPVPGFQAGDFAGALMAVIGVFAAVAQRAHTGKGCEIDLAMFDALLNLCPIPLTSALARLAGASGEPAQEVFGKNPRYSTYLSKDGKPIAVSLLEAKAWQEFCRAIDRPDLIDENETPADRLTAHGARQGRYREALAAHCASRTAAELERELDRTGIAICPVYTPDEALAHPHVEARGDIAYIEHPVEGRIAHLVNPLARSGLCRREHDPAPTLGQHTAEILAELGYSREEIDALRAKTR
ncbi:MAG: CoA transferase [Burkholderiales bacterium]|nr:CoA transferase [Burkholderiales bacterium]